MPDCNRKSHTDGEMVARCKKHFQIRCAQCALNTLVFSMGHGHCSNVIFNSLLDFSGAPIHSITYFYRIFFSYFSQEAHGSSCNNARIFSNFV